MPEATTPPPPAARAVTSDRLMLLVFFVILACAVGLAIDVTYGPLGGDKTVSDRAKYLCWGFLAAMGLLGVVVYAFMSPNVGRLKATAFGAEVELGGREGGQ